MFLIHQKLMAPFKRVEAPEGVTQKSQLTQSLLRPLPYIHCTLIVDSVFEVGPRVWLPDPPASRFVVNLDFFPHGLSKTAWCENMSRQYQYARRIYNDFEISRSQTNRGWISMDIGQLQMLHKSQERVELFMSAAFAFGKKIGSKLGPINWCHTVNTCQYQTCSTCGWTFPIRKSHKASQKKAQKSRNFQDSRGSVDGWNPAPVEVGTLSHYLQGFIQKKVVVWDFFHQQYYQNSVFLNISSNWRTASLPSRPKRW